MFIYLIRVDEFLLFLELFFESLISFGVEIIRNLNLLLIKIIYCIWKEYKFCLILLIKVLLDE